jgi:hypothetical protein
MDTRRASVSLEAESGQRKGNEAVTGVGTFYRVSEESCGGPSAPQLPGEAPSPADSSLMADYGLTISIGNTNLGSYNYPSAMKYSYNPDPAQRDHRIPISVVPSQTRSRNAPLFLPLALSATRRFSRRGTLATSSRLPTPAFGERNRGELDGNWKKSMMGPEYQASTVRLEYGVDPPTTSGRPDLERMTESTSIAGVGTVDQNYEKGREGSLRVVGELTRGVTADGQASGAGTSMGSRVEEKLKRMKEKRRELERV